jgi:hypothetical protein
MSNSAVSNGGLTGQFFINDRKIQFDWVVDNPSQYSYYEIMINGQIYTTTTTTWTIDNVFPGSYTAKIRGNVTCGRTLWSGPVTVIANYPPPTFLKNLFTRVHTHIEYEWADLNYDVYELDLDGVIITKQIDELTHTKELAISKTHKARVRGKINMFNFTTEWSNYVDVIADYPGTNITNITFNRENVGSEFFVEWDTHPDAYQYEVEWIPQFKNFDVGGVWQKIRLFEPVYSIFNNTTTSYAFAMLKLGFNYEFRIRVIYKKYNKTDEDKNKMFSVWSDPKSNNPLYKTPVLTEIGYTEATDDKERFINFKWDINNANIVLNDFQYLKYKIYRSGFNRDYEVISTLKATDKAVILDETHNELQTTFEDIGVSMYKKYFYKISIVYSFPYGDYTYETETELSNFLTTQACGKNFQREFPYGRWNNKTSNFKLFPVISVCGNNVKQSGNIYKNTTHNMTKKELYAYLSKNRRFFFR